MIIAIDGPDGAGKSTQIRAIEEWAAGCGVSCLAIGKWQVLDRTLAPQARFLRGTGLQELRLCIAEMSSPARGLFLAWLIATAVGRARAATEELVVLDGYWIKHAAAELIGGCDPALVDAIGAALGPVDAVIYLDVTPEEALRRKGIDLTPYECGCDPGCSPDRFLAHQHVVRDRLLAWAAANRWEVVSTELADTAQFRLRELIGGLLERSRGAVPPMAEVLVPSRFVIGPPV